MEMTSGISCISLVLISLASFYSGYICSSLNEYVINANAPSTDCATLYESLPEVRQRIATRVEEELHMLSGPFLRDHQNKLTSISDGEIFPKSASSFALGIIKVSKAELLSEYDFGVPNKHKPNEDDTDALILYNHPGALPSEKTLQNEATHGKLDNGRRFIANASVPLALASCATLNTIFLPLQNSPRNSFPECYLMMSDFESYHINRWMRLPDFASTPKQKDRVLNHALPLRHVGRITLATKGVDELDVPILWDDFDDRKKGFLFQHFDVVRTFLENVDAVLKDLKKLLHDRKVVRSDNTVIVMTVNKGQSELLTNFICSARRRGLDIGSLLVFPTDIESKILADGLGVATYYDQMNFERLPSAEAKIYGDPIFCQMMFAKVTC